ncbi:HD domain-containing protein [Robertmurraya yapensis]|uniref:HD domain-containing protein n=2 Tax=Bacillaceae TaxID=186817 RepID=A0A431W910_9BACI|nr:HD domain-containing protein [Bacillus yapensis]RTR31969.1 HD domain-containing protein [Bacillus yapensis]TKS95983.1 HD domain-containing protein [Bacillus yapensis]
MRLISIDDYNPKLMQLARPIYDKHRRVLLGAGRSIHPTYLQRIKELDIRYLFVEDAVSYGITMEEMVDIPNWMDAIDVLKKAYDAVVEKKELPIRELQRQVLLLVDEVSKRKAIFLVPTSSLAEELREYAHSINVTLLALQLAKKLGISQIQIKDFAMGCLLHDIGKVLTVSDESEHHARVGFEYLRKIREVSLLSAHVAYQHHEAVDGSGEPRGLDAKEIHEFAQVCALANFYENSLSKEGLSPHEAMEYVMTKSNTMFRADLISLFVQQVPSYIPGTKVRLNNGREGIVTKILGNLQRPYIRYLDTSEELSLAEHHTLLITEVLQEV